MPRLNYNVRAWNAPSHSVVLVVLSNYGSSPQARIYEENAAPPAFSPMIPINGNTNYRLTINPPSPGSYIVEYTDSNGIKNLGKVVKVSQNSGCYADSNVVDFYWMVLDGEVRVYFGHQNSFSSVDEVSIDGGNTYKTINNITHLASWNNSELTALGIVGTMVTIRVRRASTSCVTVFGYGSSLGETLLPLSVQGSKTDVTSNGGNDGTITIAITGGSGSYSYLWNDGSTTKNRTGLSAGSYSIMVTDNITSETASISFQINEPGPIVGNGSKLEIPFMNSLHFVVNPITDPDNEDTFQGLDNVLLCDQEYPGFECTNYYQKIIKSDSRIVQFNSDFSFHTIGVHSYITDELFGTFPSELKEQNINVVEEFGISIRNHIGNPGQSRVYFNIGTPPIPMIVGDVVEIINNSDGFNGSYAIVSIQIDISLGYSYLVINRNYNIAAASSLATGRFITSPDDFNVYETVINFNSIPNGLCYVKIAASDGEGNISVGISEPIDLQLKHEGTTLIEYRNFDNAFGITWTTGYIGRIRVESTIGHKRSPGGERNISRNSNYSPVKTSAKKTRVVILETIMLPPYLHEKLSVIFDMDFFAVNKIQYQSTEGYSEPQYISQFLLASSSIKLEQVNWFGSYNSDDIGTVSEGGFIAIDEQGLLRI